MVLIVESGICKGCYFLFSWCLYVWFFLVWEVWCFLILDKEIEGVDDVIVLIDCIVGIFD